MQFKNTWQQELRGCYSTVQPTPLRNARLLYYNAPLAAELELSDEHFKPENTGLWSGESLAEGMQPLAQVYSGHQFGAWAGRLGDGRGLLLGEQLLTDGRKVDWHLKGAGLTPYSRMGDGRAVMRSTLREFLASEAMHGLGIPTTRALTIVASDEPVYRETTERGAMLLRVAESHLRFGHFEHFYYLGDRQKVTELADYAIRHHWPHLQQEADKYHLWFSDVVKRTARLIASWQSAGFAHGVMNTDNMSILGLTLDYGPYGFLDDYQPGLICNHTDHQGRYSFENQPMIGLWNLNRLAHALSDLMTAEQLKQALSHYETELMRTWGEKMRAKLGMTIPEKHDNDILTALLSLMAREGSDYTRTFRMLSDSEQHQSRSALRDEFIDREAFDSWYNVWRQRVLREECSDEARQLAMKQANPALVLRNYLAQQVIEQAENENTDELARLHLALTRPFDDAPEFNDLMRRPPEWAKKIEVSCSS